MAISNNFDNQLPKIRECLAKHPVERAWLFGSFSRGQERPDSDVDFLVEYTPKENLSLLEIAGLWRSLHDLLGREVDVVENGYLMPYAEKTANNDKILIYERTAKR